MLSQQTLGRGAVADNTGIPIFSFCEGPIVFPPVIAKAAGLDPAKLKANMTGVNHNVWSNEATYDGRDAIEVLRERWAELRDPLARWTISISSKESERFMW